MRNLSEYSGINVFIGTPDSLQEIPAISKHYALTISVDEQGKISGLDYYDPVQGKQTVPLGSIDIDLVMQQINELAARRSIDLTQDSCQMLHFRPDDIQEILPNLFDHYIRPDIEYAQAFFAAHPEEVKFNRKASGLSHSYLHDPSLGEIQSENKKECRLVWNATIPTQTIFENLPINTSGVYVVVPQSKDNPQSQLFYLPKGDATTQAKLVSTPSNLEVYEMYKLNNQGLTKEDLEYFPKQLHLPDADNVYGAGNFARVKKTAVKVAGDNHIGLAGKIQKLKKGDKFGTKLGGRTEEIAKLKREADIIYDLDLGSSEVLIREDKAHMHMFAKGIPLNKKTPNANLDKKLDYAIQFLLAVDRLHSGEASKTDTPYAHRDLKPANVLVDENDHITLVDYGLTTPDIVSKTEMPGGTIFYAPLDQEVINHYTKRGEPIAQQSDIILSEGGTDQEKITSWMDSNQVSDDEVEEWDQVSDDEEVDEWDLGTMKDDKPLEQASDAHATQFPKNWTFCLGDSSKCITQNYLEDDKIAALRTVYCSCPLAEDEDSILTTQNFEHLPLPIQELLDSSRIAPLLSPERRSETEGFFAAVLLFYKKNPFLADIEYQQMINRIRDNPSIQRAIIAQNQSIQPTHETKRKRSNTSPTSVTSPFADAEESEQLEQKHRMKPLSDSFREKKSLYQTVKNKLMDRSSSKISPTTSHSDINDEEASSPESLGKIKPHRSSSDG